MIPLKPVLINASHKNNADIGPAFKGLINERFGLEQNGGIAISAVRRDIFMFYMLAGVKLTFQTFGQHCIDVIGHQMIVGSYAVSFLFDPFA